MNYLINKNEKIFIAGASGMAGRAIYNSFIKKEHIKGEIIALRPNIICIPAPADTNFSLGKKSFTYARFRENNGKDIPAYRLIKI